ncbi:MULTISPECIES: hypothetical protein [Klebsiella]|uniref:hypothetical protein n=1 Tax=Klebsiella TaxID=570 RepID=UPI001159A6F3|nr:MULTISPECIES: hypothetical protein [Klebsiella]HBR1347477.1 hypothetical protein [Klebsiella pneumoniae]ELQ7900207.1 hypothetical protein [Klebsiella oxytoca]MBZ7211159.1 hypothetical protein [Klebsiella michiganensis]MBZ7574288.1 hypothetical protein [Klebsiella oxytoca]MBZ7707331.1 hypothetical protein [Klebsiella oxytoca]
MNFSYLKDTLSQVSSYAWMFSVVSIILVFIGWFITYNNSLKVATRSESKSIVDAISKILNEISDLSLDYWVNQSFPPKSNPYVRKTPKMIGGGVTPGARLYLTAIHGKSIQINKYVIFLKSRGIFISDDFFSQVYLKATFECEVSYRYNKGYRVQRAQDVSSACVEFIMHLYDSFQENHPPRKPVFILKKLKYLDEKIDAWYQGLYERH